MRVYWLDCETIFCNVMVDDKKLKSFEDFECLPNSKQYIKKAWKHAEKLAKQYAKRHNLKAIYITHPEMARAAWVVK